MAAASEISRTPKKATKSRNNPTVSFTPKNPKQQQTLTQTPTPTPRRSVRKLSLQNKYSPETKLTPNSRKSTTKSRKRALNFDKEDLLPATPGKYELRKRKRESGIKPGNVKNRRVYYKKVVYDGGEFMVGDDVYVKRREDESSEEEYAEIEECRVCFKTGRAVMIECGTCLGGFHLKCLKPPLKAVPEGDWDCNFCEAKKMGKEVTMPTPPNGKKLSRTARDKLLSSDLWAARIER